MDQYVWATYGSIGARVIVVALAVITGVFLAAAFVRLSRSVSHPPLGGVVLAASLLVLAVALAAGLPQFIANDHEWLGVIGVGAFYVRMSELPVIAAWLLGLSGAVALFLTARKVGSVSGVRWMAFGTTGIGVVLFAVTLMGTFAVLDLG
ncbi:MAG TPA: hypothetical protein VIL17_03025 [Coriobacteriia bacterium]